MQCKGRFVAHWLIIYSLFLLKGYLYSCHNNKQKEKVFEQNFARGNNFFKRKRLVSGNILNQSTNFYIEVNQGEMNRQSVQVAGFRYKSFSRWAGKFWRLTISITWSRYIQWALLIWGSMFNLFISFNPSGYTFNTVYWLRIQLICRLTNDVSSCER